MAGKIDKKHLSDAVVLLRFETQYELAATLLRVQEHHESRRFAGRVFTLEQFMDWYAAEFGQFTYYEDWSGFNVPSTALEPFRSGRFDPLLEKEKRLLRELKEVRRPFYLIALARDASRSDLSHEVAHALYFTDTEYRRAVRAAMSGHDTSVVARELSRMGYAARVIPDEVHAYLVASGQALSRSMRALAPLRRELRQLFRRHAARLSLPRGQTLKAVDR